MNQEIEKIKKKTLLQLAVLVVNLKKFWKLENKKFEKLHWRYKQNEIEFNKNCLEKFKNSDFDVLRNLIRIYLHTDDNDDTWVSEVVGNLWPLTKECFMGYSVKNSEDQYYDVLIKNSKYNLHLP